MVALRRRCGRMVLPDYFAITTAVWIIGAALLADGFEALSSSGAESVEFLGAYIAARAYTYGDQALYRFINVLKPIMIIVFVGAFFDFLFNQWILRDVISNVMHTPPMLPIVREGRIRTISTFDHPIELAAFFCVVGIIFIYSQRNLERMLYAGLCGSGLIFVTISGTCAEFS